MNLIDTLTHRVRSALSQLSVLLAHKWKRSFYLYLAGIFTLLITADGLVLHLATDMRQTAFDMMVRYRIFVPKPDAEIVIVDINEASLAAMAREYGRWPWPRQVLGEFVEQIEKQHPKAIVFDILFSDPDIYNPDSDAYFDAAIAETNNTFFPMLRLDPTDDGLSQLKPAMVPGVIALGDEAQRDATVAMVLPHFKAVLDGGRIGLHNITPDIDGIVRQYPVYRDDYGWKIPSLPLRIAQQLKFPQPEAQRVLLNWRGPPFTYHSVSFNDVFADLTSKNKQRPPGEFTGKIVIIGSTAPSLFDIKPTPLSRMHPGVEILATAIDNFKHGDYLRFPDARIAYLLLTLAIVWTTAWGFYRNIGQDKFDRLFGASQFILLAITYASINLTNTYINLTGPVTFGLAYFTFARLYAFATSRELETSTVRSSQESGGELHGVLMLIRLGGQAGTLNEATREKIRKELEKTGTAAKSVEILTGQQKGVWDLFKDTLAISWLRPTSDEDSRILICSDLSAIQQAIKPLLLSHAATADNEVEWFVHEGPITGGEEARDSWRALFAETLLRWNEMKKGKS